ncbi:MAG: hypothetical protein LC754_10595 [Acidobacteria bacterium]|nr:hypothetical protein [Acidobacteriota bacterium]
MTTTETPLTDELEQYWTPDRYLKGAYRDDNGKRCAAGAMADLQGRLPFDERWRWSKLVRACHGISVVNDKSKADKHVDEIILDLQRIDEEGLFVTVTSSGLSGLSMRLSLEEFGVEVPSGLAMKVGSPTIGLVPDVYRRKLAACAAHAYGLVRKYGVPLTASESLFGNTSYRWVPQAALQFYTDAFDDACAEFESVKDDMLDHYEYICETMEKSFAELAQSIEDKLVRQGVERAGQAERLTGALVARIPTMEYIETISLNERLGTIKYSAAIQATIAAAQMENELDEIRFEAAKAAIADTISPIKEATSIIAATLADEAEKVLKSIKENGFVHGKTGAHALEVAKWTRAMNIEGATSFSDLADKLEAAVAGQTANGKTDPKRVVEVAEQIVSATREAGEAARQSGRFVALEI